MTEYRSKYIIVRIGLLGSISLDIHPMWVIDENAIIDLSFVWFIPIAAPAIALIDGIIIKIDIGILVINIIIPSGANFCQVDRIKHDIHEIDDITDGNHIWHGIIPNFSISEISNIISMSRFIWLDSIHIVDDVIKRILEPNAWARKYFSIASDSWNLFDLISNGMNDNMLISRAAQVISQLLLDRAINDLIIINIYINK